MARRIDQLGPNNAALASPYGRCRAWGARPEGKAMKAYRILVHDRRCAAPIELAAEMKHDARVVEFARDRLAASKHVAAIEVWSGATRLCWLADDEPRKAA
jgi:hypothetical protein